MSDKSDVVYIVRIKVPDSLVNGNHVVCYTIKEREAIGSALMTLGLKPYYETTTIFKYNNHKLGILPT